MKSRAQSKENRIGAAPQAGPQSWPLAEIDRAGNFLTLYGLALVLVWIGAMKFTAYEAEGIRPFVANSPFMAWLLRALGTQGVSNLLGVVEIATAVAIALRPVSARIAAAGAAMAVLTFATTLTFLISTPGWEPTLGGFPALSAFPGQFLLKDVVLLGASLNVLGGALSQAFHETGTTRRT